MSELHDSGERRHFDTGAQRDISEGKGDMMSVPPNAMLRFSVHLEKGAKKYERFNYTRGIPCTSFMDSALRHLMKYNAGMDDEDHLAAAVFNIMGMMEMEAIHPEMQDIPNRQGKKTFPYNPGKQKEKLVMQAYQSGDGRYYKVMEHDGIWCAKYQESYEPAWCTSFAIPFQDKETEEEAQADLDAVAKEREWRKIAPH